MADADGSGLEPVIVPPEIGGIWCHYKGDRIELELFPLAAVSAEDSGDEEAPSGEEPSRVWMPRQNFYDTVERMTTVANALRRIFKD
jgi:hypothetical protein